MTGLRMTGARRVLAAIATGAAIALACIPYTQASAAVSSPGRVALSWAETHEAGAPYVWGAAGPWGYDCSGAAMTAYDHAGIWLPHFRVSMLWSGHLHQTWNPRPGDLVMWGGAFPYHVELFVRPGWSYGAQSSGTVVGFHRIWGYPQYYRVS